MDIEAGWTIGAAAEGTLAFGTVQSLSGCLLEIGRLARHAGPECFLREAMQTLQRIVRFDAAWWGETMLDPAAGGAPRNLLHASIGLGADFADEWGREQAAADTFAQGSMTMLGTVFRASGGYRGGCEKAAAFIDRHGLQAIMAVTLELPDSGVLFFVALYRHDPLAAFSDGESAVFREFVGHLVQLWTHRLADTHGTTGATAPDAFALADREGRLLYLGRQVGAAIDRSTPCWLGTQLPPTLAQAIGRAPCSRRLGDARLVLDTAGQLVTIDLVGAAAPRTTLSPRESSAALLFAQGYAYKEIARMLGLTPATVRTYLRNAYARLGVNNKIALAAALQGEGRVRAR